MTRRGFQLYNLSYRLDVLQESPEQIRKWFLDLVLPEARDQWPESQLLVAALGNLVPLPLAPPDKTHQKRYRKAIQQLIGSAEFSTAREQIHTAICDGRPDKEIEALAVHEAEQIASTGVSTSLVGGLLLASAVSPAGSPAFEPPLDALGLVGPDAVRGDTRCTAWVNLSRIPIGPVAPGHIVVDVTKATQDDLIELWKMISATRRRLGLEPDKGGRADDDPMWQRIAELRKTHMWEQTTVVINSEFPRPDGETRSTGSLQRGFQNWKNRMKDRAQQGGRE